MTVEIIALDGIGEVAPHTDLADLVISHADLRDGDVVVITSKIVSKALGLATSRTRDEVAAEHTDRVVARRGETSIVRTHHGLTLAAAGVDASNIAADAVLPLPPDADGTARDIRRAIGERAGVRVAVVISDTAGRAWRIGQTDIAIGCAGLAPLDSFEGRDDHYGNPLAVTAPAIADEVAGAAELATGKLGQRPISIVRGLDLRLLLDDDGPGAAALIRAEGDDLFGLGTREAVVAASRRGLGPGAVRGFPEPLAEELAELDLVALAEPGDLAVDVTDTRFVIRASADQLIEAGMLKQRLLALGVAHGVAVGVDMVTS